jgi:dTDP-4-dehydrorhamnose 3,5-epimerase
MKITPTEIPEVFIVEPKMIMDPRGFFLEHFQADRYSALGVKSPIVQDNMSRSSKGVLRGLHFQNPNAQGKLVGVMRGRVLDVAVDVRLGSPTFGRHVAVELGDDNFRQVWIPRGFAHGYTVLTETADFFYKCDAIYSPSDEMTIRWDDPELNIDWRTRLPILSNRDASAPLLKDVTRLPRYESA